MPWPSRSTSTTGTREVGSFQVADHQAVFRAEEQRPFPGRRHRKPATSPLEAGRRTSVFSAHQDSETAAGILAGPDRGAGHGMVRDLPPGLAAGKGGHWAVTCGHGEVLGRIALRDSSFDDGTGDIASWVLPHARVVGVASRTLRRSPPGPWTTSVYGAHAPRRCRRRFPGTHRGDGASGGAVGRRPDRDRHSLRPTCTSTCRVGRRSISRGSRCTRRTGCCATRCCSDRISRSSRSTGGWPISPGSTSNPKSPRRFSRDNALRVLGLATQENACPRRAARISELAAAEVRGPAGFRM